MTISNPLPINNPLKPLNDLVESLNPFFTAFANIARFAIHHPILSVVIAFVTLFLLTGLVQKVMEWSRHFWDYFFIYSAKSVELILKGLWKLIVFAFRLITQKREPNPTKSVRQKEAS
ncbi:MAG: hypothetical protein VKL42_13790 [Snowella sp.]|nr:hypothetical protein [Snowella sp.]